LSVLSRKADPLNNADWVLVGGPSYHRGPNVGYQLPFCSSRPGRSQCRRDDLNVVGRFSLSTEHFMALLFISVPAWVLLGVPAYHRASCSLDECCGAMTYSWGSHGPCRHSCLFTPANFGVGVGSLRRPNFPSPDASSCALVFFFLFDRRILHRRSFFVWLSSDQWAWSRSIL